MAVVSGVEDPSVISREAGDKTKGFRFQKLRAAIRFLTRVEANRDGLVHCAMEFLEDSVLIDGSDKSLITGEENKFYGSGLSFNSSAIKNTLVAFLDLYFTFQRSSDVKLGIYASAMVANERISAEVRGALGYEAKQAQYGILKKLVVGQALTLEDLGIAFALTKTEYEDQYKNKKGGFLVMLQSMQLEEFDTFLKNIDWSIANETNETLEEDALHAVRTSRFFNYRHKDLEGYLLASLLISSEN